MPSYEYKCRACLNTRTLELWIGQEIPPQLVCQECHRPMKRKFSFAFMPVQNEINSQSVGKHGSTRSYNTARDKLSAEHSERVGMDVNFETFDSRDSDSDPTKKLK